MPNGLKVTLRGKRMLAFLDRLINVSLPRTRDFRGVSKKAFDQDGNYSLGIKEVTIFPEVKIDDVSKIHGMQINIVTNTKDKEQSRVLLKNIGIPFAN
jgi:large subunit ribosomal protein L5